MKKYILTLVCLVASTIIYAQSSSHISFPFNGSVFQRDNNKNATVYITGQFNVSTAYYIDYRVVQLDKNGNTASTGNWVTYGTLSATNARIFRVGITLSTGWYRVELRTRSSSGGLLSPTLNVKFGVGEVFIIAGQSNAQGYGSGAFGIQNLENLDCVRSLKNQNLDIVNLEIPVYGQLNISNFTISPNGNRTWYYQRLGNDIANMATAGKVTPVMFYNVAVSGTSINNWYGAMLRTREVFSNDYSGKINTLASTSINPTNYPNDIIWGNFQGSIPDIFTSFKNILSFYGNMFGIRAVLWHQGEAETKTLLNLNANFIPLGPTPNPYKASDYSTLLGAIIDESRKILPSLVWGISKVSLTSEKNLADNYVYNILNTYYHRNLIQATNLIQYSATSKSWLGSISSPNNIDIEIKSGKAENPISSTTISSNLYNVIKQQENVVSSRSSYVTWFTQKSDDNIAGNLPSDHSSLGYTLNANTRQSDGVHFNETGMVKMATDAYSNIINNILTKTPVLPTPPPILNLSKSGSIYIATLSNPSGTAYSKYQWESNYTASYNKYNQSIGNTNSSYSSSTSIGGYVKDSKGKIHIIPYTAVFSVAARKKVDEQTSVYPNPIVNGNSIDIRFETSESQAVEAKLVTEDGIVLYNSEVEIFEQGEHTLSIPITNFNKKYEHQFLYIHLKKGDDIQKIKIVVE